MTAVSKLSESIRRNREGHFIEFLRTTYHEYYVLGARDLTTAELQDQRLFFYTRTLIYSGFNTELFFTATQVDEYDDFMVTYLRENVSYCFGTKNPLKWMTSTWCWKIGPSTVDTYGRRLDRDRNGEYARRRDHTRKRKLKTKNIVPR